MESTSLRLLRYLRPYRGRLIVTALLMVGFALSSGITIGMISPFVKVLFTPRPAQLVAADEAVDEGSSTAGAPGERDPVALHGVEAVASDLVRALLPHRKPAPFAHADLPRAPGRVPSQEHLRLPPERAHGLGRAGGRARSEEPALRAPPRSLALFLPQPPHGRAPLPADERPLARPRRARRRVQQRGEERASSRRVPVLDLLDLLAARAPLPRRDPAFAPPHRLGREETPA